MLGGGINAYEDFNSQEPGSSGDSHLTAPRACPLCLRHATADLVGIAHLLLSCYLGHGCAIQDSLAAARSLRLWFLRSDCLCLSTAKTSEVAAMKRPHRSPSRYDVMMEARSEDMKKWTVGEMQALPPCHLTYNLPAHGKKH